MENNKATRFVSQSARFPAPSVFARFCQWINNLAFNPPVSKPEQQLQLVPGPLVARAPKNRHEAIIGLMNGGKRFDDAEAIVKTAEDWNLDLDLLDMNSLSVSGQSVWIDVED